MKPKDRADKLADFVSTLSAATRATRPGQPSGKAAEASGFKQTNFTRTTSARSAAATSPKRCAPPHVPELEVQNTRKAMADPSPPSKGASRFTENSSSAGPPLYEAEERLSEAVRRRDDLAERREELAHTGAHKINNAVGQTESSVSCISKVWGSTAPSRHLHESSPGEKAVGLVFDFEAVRTATVSIHTGFSRQKAEQDGIIAETGGQHGVRRPTVCALLGLECVIYMGAVDCGQAVFECVPDERAREASARLCGPVRSDAQKMRLTRRCGTG